MAVSPRKYATGFKQEALAVLGIFLASFLFLSLLSRTLATEKNWCGEIGEFISRILIGFTGWGAYLLAALLFISAFFFFSPKMSFGRLPHVTAGLIGAVVSFCGLLSALSLKEPCLIEAGGVFGERPFLILNQFIGGPGQFFSCLLYFSSP